MITKKILKLKILSKIRGYVHPLLLVEKGMKLGKNSDFGDNCMVDQTFCWLIEIGDNVTISNNVSFIAHDASLQYVIGYTKLGRIIIEDNCFIGARSIILPNVKIGKGSIVGAGSLVNKNIPAGEVWAGNPARKIMDVTEYKNKYSNMNLKKFDATYLYDKSKHKYIINETSKKGITLIE